MAIESQGAIFYWSTTTAASTSTSHAVAEVVGFNGPTGSANVIDVSHLGSTAREKLIVAPRAGAWIETYWSPCRRS